MKLFCSFERIPQGVHNSTHSRILYTFHCYPFCLQKEKILENREKRVRQIEQSLRVVQMQIDGHTSGTKPVDEGKLVSLKNRVEKYRSEIADFSRQLSDKVGGPVSRLTACCPVLGPLLTFVCFCSFTPCYIVGNSRDDPRIGIRRGGTVISSGRKYIIAEFLSSSLELFCNAPVRVPTPNIASPRAVLDKVGNPSPLLAFLFRVPILENKKDGLMIEACSVALVEYWVLAVWAHAILVNMPESVGHL
jgi:hypothetical protein